MPLIKISPVLFCLLLYSCVKYSFKGALPSNLQTIYIFDFENQTQYPRVREELNQQITEAFIDDNSLRVINEEKTADLVLRGTITGIRRQPVSITVDENVNEFQMVVSLRAECINTHNQKPLWEGSISRYGIISGSALSDEIDSAIDNAVEQLVEDIITKTIAAW
jgi:outer membrane lipopolysaccharide assembly protein LptE/RlpB